MAKDSESSGETWDDYLAHTVPLTVESVSRALGFRKSHANHQQDVASNTIRNMPANKLLIIALLILALALLFYPRSTFSNRALPPSTPMCVLEQQILLETYNLREVSQDRSVRARAMRKVLQEVANDDFIIIRNPESKKVLDVDQCGIANGDLVQLWERNGGRNQIWVLDGNAIRNVLSNKFLDVPQYTLKNTSKIQIWDFNDSGSQKWEVTLDGTVIHSDTGKALTARTNDCGVSLTEVNGRSSQQWELIRLSSLEE